MSNAAHTPGPWTFGHLGHDRLWVGPSHDEPPVATVPWDCDEARDEARANAALLAAAPALLAALRRLAVVRHVRLTYGGGDTPSGGACKLCKSEWRETSTEFHSDDCLLTKATGAAP